MFKLTNMTVDHIPCALSIWHDHFDRYCKCENFPDFWNGGNDTVEQYLKQQIERGNAVVAKQDDRVLGYMAWMHFDFHKERTAFLPIVGSAAVAENETAVFHELYLAASRKWVRDDRFNHMWMTFYDDIELKDMLYDKGFGSYVIDACQKTRDYKSSPAYNYKIIKATPADVDTVLAMANEADKNLSNPPVFLTREPWQKEEIIKLINDYQVFIAWDKDCAAGLVSLDINRKHHFEKLTCIDSAYIGGIGAYIKPEYRGKGIGTQLVNQAFDYCHEAGKSFLHVSFESANPDAIRFWPKYFKPAIRSVRRTINKDANCPI